MIKNLKLIIILGFNFFAYQVYSEETCPEVDPKISAKSPQKSTDIENVLELIKTPGARLHELCPRWKFVPAELINAEFSNSACPKVIRPVEVYIYGESHSDRFDQNLKVEIRNHAERTQEKIQYLDEGSLGDRFKKAKSLRDGQLIEDYTSLRLLENFGSSTDTNNINSLSFTYSACANKNIWKKIPRPLKDKKEEKFAKLNDQLFLKYKNCQFELVSDEAQKVIMALGELKFPYAVDSVIYLYIRAMEDALLQDSLFKGIKREDLKVHCIQELRELSWIKLLNQLLCSPKRIDEKFWFQIGSHHTSSLSCALQAIYQDKIKISLRDQSYNKFNQKIDEIGKHFAEVDYPKIIAEIQDEIKELKAITGNTQDKINNIKDMPYGISIYPLIGMTEGKKVTPNIERLMKKMRIKIENYLSRNNNFYILDKETDVFNFVLKMNVAKEFLN